MFIFFDVNNARNGFIELYKVENETKIFILENSSDLLEMVAERLLIIVPEEIERIPDNNVRTHPAAAPCVQNSCPMWTVKIRK